MSLGQRLVHRLVIVTPSVPDEDDVDDRGQPVAGTPITTEVRGLVQPRTARELAQSNQAGAEQSDHIIFLLPQPLRAAGYIRDEPDTGRRFDIVGVRSFEFGRSPHLEVDCKLVGSPEGPLAEGS